MILAGMICFILIMKMKDHESTDSLEVHDRVKPQIQYKHSEKLFNDDHSPSEPKTTSKPFEEGVQNSFTLINSHDS